MSGSSNDKKKDEEPKQKGKEKGQKTNDNDVKHDQKKRTTFAEVDISKTEDDGNAEAGPLPSNVINVENLKDLTDTIQTARDKLVVLYFFAVWCGSCKMISPRVDDFSRQFANAVAFIKMDSEVCEAAAEQYEVSVLPFFVFLRNGLKLDTFVGSNPDKLKDLIVKHSKGMK